MIQKHTVEACEIFLKDKIETFKIDYALEDISEATIDNSRYYKLKLKLDDISLITALHQLNDEAVKVADKLSFGSLKVYVAKYLVDTVEYKLRQAYRKITTKIYKDLKAYAREKCTDGECPNYGEYLVNGKCNREKQNI